MMNITVIVMLMMITMTNHDDDYSAYIEYIHASQYRSRRLWVEYSRCDVKHQFIHSYTNDQRNTAIGRLQAGETHSAVSRLLNVHLTTISRLWDRFTQNGNVRDRPTSGSPRVTTEAQDRYIRFRHLRDRSLRAASTTAAIPGLRIIYDPTKESPKTSWFTFKTARSKDSFVAT